MTARWVVAGVLAGLLIGAGAVVVGGGSSGPGATARAADEGDEGDQPMTPATAQSLRYPPNAPQLAAIRVAAVHGGPLPAARAINGRVVYDEDVTVRITSSAAGRVVAVRARLGDRVAKGAVLAQLDSPDVATAAADSARAAADERRKRETRDRVAELVAAETAPRKDLEAAEAELRMATADAGRAAQKLHNLGLAAAEADRALDGRLALRTPIAGTVVDRQLNDGMEVRPDLASPLYTVSDPERLWVMADIPDDVVPQLRLGEPVRIAADAWPGVAFDATVDAIPTAVDPGTRRLQARCLVRNPGGRLKAEMFVHVSFLAGRQRRAVEVPNAALVLQGIRQLVIVQTAPGVFARREVEVELSGADSSFVTAGLADGDKVVTEGALLLLGEFPTHAR